MGVQHWLFDKDVYVQIAMTFRIEVSGLFSPTIDHGDNEYKDCCAAISQRLLTSDFERRTSYHNERLRPWRLGTRGLPREGH